MFGADESYAFALELERLGQAEELATAGALIASFERGVGRILAALAEFVKSQEAVPPRATV
jgi:hypothetical protein